MPNTIGSNTTLSHSDEIALDKENLRAEDHSDPQHPIATSRKIIIESKVLRDEASFLGDPSFDA